MTREEIEKAWLEQPIDDVPSMREVVNFALEMVRRHNEELAKVSRRCDSDGIVEAMTSARPSRNGR